MCNSLMEVLNNHTSYVYLNSLPFRGGEGERERERERERE